MNVIFLKTARRVAWALCLSVATAFSFTVAAEPADEGRIKKGAETAALCVACHQADGNGLDAGAGNPWPRLAGLDAAYLAQQLQAFKEGRRNSPEMLPFATMLDEQQVADVSAYFASLPPKAPAESAEPNDEQLALGEKLATRGDWNRQIVACIDCHGPGNRGVGSVFPGIAGQHAGYLAKQLRDWQEGNRSGDPLELMRTIAARMNDDDIVAVSAWLASQSPVATKNSEASDE